MAEVTRSAMDARLVAEALRGRKDRNPLLDFLIRLVRDKPLGAVGGALVVAMVFMAVFADIISPYGYAEVNPVDRFFPPFTSEHILGADVLGRDLLARIVYGARISMYVGLGAVAIGTTVATTIGLICGYFGGKLDSVIQRFVDAWMCFPGLIILLSIMAIIGPGILNIILVLGFFSSFASSRVVRGAVLSTRENQFVEAAHALGCSNFRIVIRYILPNVMAPIIILATVGLGNVILAEASISFLGYGVPPPEPSWGAMISGTSRTYLLMAPWLAFWPGFALSLAVFGFNMLGDALRDLLDPRLRGAGGRLSG